MIFKSKIISVEKRDKNYGLEFATDFTNKYAIFHDEYNITYVLENDIHGDILETLLYNINKNLSQILRKLSVVENTQNKISYI